MPVDASKIFVSVADFREVLRHCVWSEKIRTVIFKTDEFPANNLPRFGESIEIKNQIRGKIIRSVIMADCVSCLINVTLWLDHANFKDSTKN